ncbi:MAG TPA: hypothetical protein PLI17_20095, partial [Denitromonas sp.]|nr:hypothetical protein [Denitromonas sp.]
RNCFITAFGRNVSPEWVESELTAEPDIAMAAVFGEALASNVAVLVTRHDDAAADNNLAMVLLELGRRDEARSAAKKAVSLGGPFQAQAADTLRRVNE